MKLRIPSSDKNKLAVCVKMRNGLFYKVWKNVLRYRLLSCRITKWPTTAKSNIDRLNKLQNQVALLLDWAQGSTKISLTDNKTDLEIMEDRCDIRILQQVKIYKRQTNHLMHQ